MRYLCCLVLTLQGAVQLPIAQVQQYVVQCVQEVGALVLANLQSASAAVAHPTIQEARAKKFEYIPSASCVMYPTVLIFLEKCCQCCGGAPHRSGGQGKEVSYA